MVLKNLGDLAGGIKVTQAKILVAQAKKVFEGPEMSFEGILERKGNWSKHQQRQKNSGAV